VRNRAAGVAQLPRERLTAGLPRCAGRGITDQWLSLEFLVTISRSGNDPNARHFGA
jgi:hypothetical protein